MEGFKRDFYAISKKLKRKSESFLGFSSFYQSQQLRIQTGYNEQKKSQKATHVIRPTSEEKPRKQKKSALHQEVSDFNPSDQMSVEQLIKVVLNLQEEVKKLRKDNEKLMDQLNQAEGIESRLMSQERELSAF